VKCEAQGARRTIRIFSHFSPPTIHEQTLWHLATIENAMAGVFLANVIRFFWPHAPISL